MMYDDLNDKRVVVTGGASGIGLATARRFVKESCRVVILDRNQEALNQAQSEHSNFAGGIRADVSSPDEVEAAFEEIDHIMGGIDILVSNAGISVRKPFANIDYDQWSEVMRVNLDGMYLCSKAAIDRMKTQRSGVILFTASTSGIGASPLYADYSASKAALINLAKTIAVEYAPWLRVNAICPGYVLTPMQKAEYTAEMLAEVNASIPMRRRRRGPWPTSTPSFSSCCRAPSIVLRRIPNSLASLSPPGIAPRHVPRISSPRRCSVTCSMEDSMRKIDIKIIYRKTGVVVEV